MGTWGTRNFDNDSAGDFYLQFIERMMMEIRLTMKNELRIHAGNYWGDVIPCMIDLIRVIAEQDFHCLDLDTEEFKRWKQTFMDRWRMTIYECNPDEEYRKEREQVLNDTFDNLIAVSERK